MAARRAGGFFLAVGVTLAVLAGTAVAEDPPVPPDPPDTTPPVIALDLNRARFSPNGDGNADLARITVTVDEEATVSVVLRRAGADLRTLAQDRAVTTEPLELEWRGLDDLHQRVADGRLTVLVTATDLAGNIATSTANLVVDTTAPRFTWIHVPSQPLSTTGPLSLRYRVLGEANPVRLVFEATDAYGHATAPRRPLVIHPGTHDAPWTLADRHGRPVTPGLYRLRATAIDDVGNKRHSVQRVVRIHRPVQTEVVRQIAVAPGRVALTFDDCNDGAAWTRILNILTNHLTGASFFCIGSNVRRYPAQARRTANTGFTIGSHSPDHESMTGLGASEVARRLRLDQQSWWDVAHTTPSPFFRPPYGDQDLGVRLGAGQAGFRWTVLWEIDPRDWERPGASEIARRVLTSIKAGSIVVMHALPQTADALPAILDGLRARGLRSVGLSEMMWVAGRH